MMELWGADSCTECKIIKIWLQQKPLDIKYVDVALIPNFEGEIPFLLLEDGRKIIGLGPIRVFATQLLEQMGF